MTSCNVSAYSWKKTEETVCHKFFPQNIVSLNTALMSRSKNETRVHLTQRVLTSAVSSIATQRNEEFKILYVKLGFTCMSQRYKSQNYVVTSNHNFLCRRLKTVFSLLLALGFRQRCADDPNILGCHAV
jgi:hypothetical protein